MRLINFGAGEAADRLTILSLKIHYADQAGKPPDHFRTEQIALLARLKAGNGLASYLDELLELATVNGALWRCEDELRDLREQEGDVERIGQGDPMLQDIARLAFRIQALNDRRAALIEAINTKTGEHRGSEKL